MNSIPERQNQESNVRLLAAQRQLYSTAKRILGWQLILSGPVPVCFGFLSLAFPELRSYAALWGILVSISDLSWLTPWQRRLRTAAAQVQEQFDCLVLELPWNELKVGRQPRPELVKEQSVKYQTQSGSMPPLTNWYDPEVGSVPLPIARLVCQQANCWWDAKQRRSYATVVVGAVLVICVLMIIFAMHGGLTIERFLLGVVAPLSPTLLLGYRQFTEQIDAANRLDTLRDHAERLWMEALSGVSQALLSTRSRVLQDEIFDNRKRSPLVFDAVFRRLRPRYQLLMNHTAAHYVAEAKQKLRLP